MPVQQRSDLVLRFGGILPGGFVLWFNHFRFRHSEQRLHGPREVPQGRRAFVARLGLHGLLTVSFCHGWLAKPNVARTSLGID